LDPVLEVEHRSISGNGINLHLAIQGEGPLVVLCHGFPGLWYSWRKQIPALAAAGYRVVAVDQRGYGRSDRPLDPQEYDSDILVADMLAVLDAMGEEQAVFVGQDFGAPLVWNIAARAPRRVRAAVIMGVPYDFERAGAGDGELGSVQDIPPTEQYALVAREHFFHMHYFQKFGPADAELGSQPRDFLERLYWALGAEGSLLDWRDYPSEGTGYLDVLAEPGRPLPWSWLTLEDLDYIEQEYVSAGVDLAFIGGLNSYRVADRNWEIAKQYGQLRVQAPVLFLMGEKDPVRDMLPEEAYSHMQQWVPNLRGIHLIEGAGHFVMQEAPQRVNQLLLDFLQTLSSE
jgi:pimeloyl-ACP methyl ester carboxylesterase